MRIFSSQSVRPSHLFSSAEVCRSFRSSSSSVLICNLPPGFLSSGFSAGNDFFKIAKDYGDSILGNLAYNADPKFSVYEFNTGSSFLRNSLFPSLKSLPCPAPLPPENPGFPWPRLEKSRFPRGPFNVSECPLRLLFSSIF